MHTQEKLARLREHNRAVIAHLDRLRWSGVSLSAYRKLNDLLSACFTVEQYLALACRMRAPELGVILMRAVLANECQNETGLPQAYKRGLLAQLGRN